MLADEARLVGEAASADAQRASGDGDPDAWLALLCSALAFSINMTEFKLTSLSRDAARMITDMNVVGAALSVRAMLEHHAVALELGRKLTKTWAQLEKVAIEDGTVAALVADAEKHIARVLAATPESKERASEWRRLWASSVRRYHVLEPVKALDREQPGFLKVYGLLSHIVHGTVCTGGDLLGPGGADVVRRQLTQLVGFLAEVYDVHVVINRQAPVAWMAHRLASLRGNPEPVLGARVERSRLPPGYKLKPNRDIFGTGTKEDPFRFRRGLLYHEAYGRYLTQEAISVKRRALHDFQTHRFGDEVETEDGRVLYFLNDTLPTPGSHGAEPG